MTNYNFLEVIHIERKKVTCFSGNITSYDVISFVYIPILHNLELVLDVGGGDGARPNLDHSVIH